MLKLKKSAPSKNDDDQGQSWKLNGKIIGKFREKTFFGINLRIYTAENVNNICE